MHYIKVWILVVFYRSMAFSGVAAQCHFITLQFAWPSLVHKYMNTIEVGKE